MLLQAVSRFQLGEEIAPRRIEPAPIAPITPIKVKPATAALPPSHGGAYAAALNGASRRPAAQAGQWEEF
jgi:hypothetical protein